MVGGDAGRLFCHRAPAIFRHAVPRHMPAVRKVVNSDGFEVNLKRIILSVGHNGCQQDYEYIGQFFHEIHYIW